METFSLVLMFATFCSAILIWSEYVIARALGWFIILTNILFLLAGCATNVESRDTIVPGGAVTASVLVPTCSDDLAKTLFATSVRPDTLPINTLTAADKDDYEKVSKAYMDTIEILTKYAVAQERDRAQAQQQCVAIRNQVNTLNTKTPVIPVQK